MTARITMTCAKCGRAYTPELWQFISRGQVRKDVMCSCGAVGEYRIGVEREEKSA